jgi:hypothetical protein
LNQSSISACVCSKCGASSRKAAGRDQRQRGQQHARRAAQPAEPRAQPFPGARVQQRQRQQQHRRIGPQIRQVPQVVPGEAVFPAVEGILRPGAELPVTPQEGTEAGLHLAVRNTLAIGLHRHHGDDAEGQRQQQAQGALGEEFQRAAARVEQADRDAREQEQQRHAPAVEEVHRHLEPLGQIRALEVPLPLGHVEHADVVEDQQTERDHAQGVDVVAAGGLGGHGGSCGMPHRADCRIVASASVW